MARLVRKGDNKWLVRVFMGRDAAGKQLFHNKTIVGNKKTAQGYARDVETKRDLGTFVEPTELTLSEFLDKWLAEGLCDVQPRTKVDYTDVLKRWVRPMLGRRKLNSLTPLDVQALYNALSARGLSGRSVQYAHAVLSSALKQAVGWRLITFNPATYTKRPRNEKKEIQFLQPEEAERFLAAAREEPLGVVLVFALATGMRPEEYLGLRWEDVNLEAGTTKVQQVLIERAQKKGGWYFGPPKTAAGRRTITLTASVVSQLVEHKRRQLEDVMKAGAKYQRHDLVFAVPYSPFHPMATGAPLMQRNLRHRHLVPILKRSKLPATLHLYCLRHSYATLALAGGMDPKMVSQSMGHSSVAFTQDTYQHVLPSMQQQAAVRLEQILFGR
jgi:integrase